MADLFFGGGINETDDFNISPDECVSGENFQIDVRSRSFRRRPTQDLKGTATNGKAIKGIMQMITSTNVVTNLVKAGEVLYSWDGTNFTSERSADITTSSRYRSTYWALDDLLIINDIDLNDPLFKWDGSNVLRLKTSLSSGLTPTAISTLSSSGTTATAIVSTHGYTTGDLVIIADANQAEYNGEYEITVSDANTFTYTFAGSAISPATGSPTVVIDAELSAKYSIVKDNRVWLFNIKAGGTATPHAILVSEFEEPENYDNSVRGQSQDPASSVTGNSPFFLLAPDLKPIDGVVLFYNILVISTEGGRLYKLTGTDPTDYNFVDYYPDSFATTEEGIVNIGNDVMFVREGNNIELLSDTEQSGDVSVDDASRFIPITKNDLVDPIAVYDPSKQHVLFFNEDFILVFNKDAALQNPNVSPWSKWTTLMPAGFDTDAATYLKRPNMSTYSVYWGNQVGEIYDLNGSGQDGDAGSYNILAKRKSKFLEELPSNVGMTAGRIQYKRAGQCTLNMTFDWAEEYNSTTCAVPLKGPLISGDPNFFGDDDLYWGADEYWNQGTVTGDNVTDNQVSTVGFSAVGRSMGFFLTMSIEDTANFIIDKVTA